MRAEVEALKEMLLQAAQPANPANPTAAGGNPTKESRLSDNENGILKEKLSENEKLMQVEKFGLICIATSARSVGSVTNHPCIRIFDRST